MAILQNYWFEGMKKVAEEEKCELGPWANLQDEMNEDEQKDKKESKRYEKLNLPKMTNRRSLISRSTLTNKEKKQFLQKKSTIKINQGLPEALKSKVFAFNQEFTSSSNRIFPKSFRKATKKMKVNYEELLLSQKLEQKENQNQIIDKRNITNLKFLSSEANEEEEESIIRHQNPQKNFVNREHAKKRSLIDLARFLKKEFTEKQTQRFQPVHKRYLSLNEKEMEAQMYETSKLMMVSSQKFNPLLQSSLDSKNLKKNFPAFEHRRNNQRR